MCGHEQDDRSLYPGVGKMYIYGPGRSGFCTGFLIEDTRILTAAHCVFDGTIAQEGGFHISFGMTDVNTFIEDAEGLVKDCEIPDEYVKQRGKAYDYARCDITRKHKNDDVKILPKQAHIPKSGIVVLVSYPEAPVNGFDEEDYPVGYTPYAEACIANYRTDHAVNVWLYECSTASGASGGPLIGEIDSLSVIGNHAATFNSTMAKLYNGGPASFGKPSG